MYVNCLMYTAYRVTSIAYSTMYGYIMYGYTLYNTIHNVHRH